MKLLRIDHQGVLLQNETSGEIKRTDEAKILVAIEDGRLVVDGAKRNEEQALTERQVDTLEVRGVSKRAIEIGETKLRWLAELHRNGVDRVIDKPWVRAIMEKLLSTTMKGAPAIALSTLAEAQRSMYKANGDPTVVVPNYQERGGRGKLRVQPRALEIMNAEIERARDEGFGRVVQKQVYQNIVAIVNRHNVSAPFDPIETPSASTVSRQIGRLIPAKDMLERAMGTSYAKKIYRQNAYPRDKAQWPLEVGEYDDIDAGVFLVDEQNGLPWGRAYVTNGVSQAAGLILGYALGDEPRSYDSAIAAICHSLRPKPECLPGEMGYGMQGQILLDNATYNTSTAIGVQSEAARLLLSLARPFGPTEKASIEYLNAVIKQDFCRGLPGWVGPKENRLTLKEGMEGAVMTLSEFRAKYHHWVTKIYANKPGEDGKTPKQRWLEVYGRHGPAVHFTNEQIEFLLLRPSFLKFRASGGLLRLGLRYDSPALEAVREQVGMKTSLPIFGGNSLDYLIVVDPLTKAKLKVPCVEDPKYFKNITARQQKMILAACREQSKTNASLDDLYEARCQLQAMVVDARKSNKLRVRKWARANEMPSPTPDAGEQVKAKEATKLMTDLEFSIEQLKQVNLDEPDRW